MTGSFNIEITITGGKRPTITGSAAKTAAKVKLEGGIAHGFEAMAHAVRGPLASKVLHALGHLTHVATAYAVGSFAADWATNEIHIKDAVLRATVGNGLERLPLVLSRLLPTGGAAFGVGQYAAGRVANTWLLGTFDLDGRSTLRPGSRFLLEAPVTEEMVTFRADVERRYNG